MNNGTSSKDQKNIDNKDKTTTNPLNEKLSDSGNKQRKILMISGPSLFFIFREESLLKCFLTITTFCDIIIGSGMSPN